LFASSEPLLKLADVGAGVDPNACVPWLQEMRNWDLRHVAGESKVGDMKATRLQCFKARVGGQKTLTKSKFFESLPKWYRGPSTDEAEKLFNKLDTSGDGTLDFEEYNWENLCGFRGALLTSLGAQIKLFSQGFSILDKNKDGDLKKDEFISESIVLLGLSDSTAQAIFAVLDVGESPGVITRKEFELLGGLPRMRLQVEEKEPDQRDAFKQADKNSDGNLDQPEFVAHAQDMGDFKNANAVTPVLHQLDANSDGTIAKDEYINKCYRMTGGTCNGMRKVCNAWRGPVFCASGTVMQLEAPCTCAPGYCAKNGGCIPEELHSSKDSPLGPDAGGVLSKMKDITVQSVIEKYLGGKGNTMNPAEGVAAVLLGIAIMIQLKGAFTAFPELGVATFFASVLAFTSVTTTCFRAYSAPKSIENSLQIFLMILLFCAITNAVLSLVRVWGPSGNKIPLICWYTTDDEDEWGLNVEEEFKVRIYNNVFKITMLVCVAALWEAPLDGVKSNQTRFMLIMLYVFIVALVSQLLEEEVNSVACRRQKCELHVGQITQNKKKTRPHKVHHAKLPCLAAWWNEFLMDDQLKEYAQTELAEVWPDPDKRKLLPNANRRKRCCTFELQRTYPEPKDIGNDPGDDPRFDDMPELKPNELVFVAPGGWHGNRVFRKVVVMWEDTHIQLVVRGLVSKDVEVSTSEDWKLMGPNPDAFPSIQVVDPSEVTSSQSLQQKMWIVTQAGASGLIIGQRSSGGLEADKFGGVFDENPASLDKSQNFWYHEYETKYIQKRKDEWNFNREWVGRDMDSVLQFMFGGGEANSKTKLGCAVNTFLLYCADMQELEWLLEETRQDTHSLSIARDRASKSSSMPGESPEDSDEEWDEEEDPDISCIYAGYAVRRRANGEGAAMVQEEVH
jgi:Ca2+-binding EF-hand superfamily protein